MKTINFTSVNTTNDATAKPVIKSSTIKEILDVLRCAPLSVVVKPTSVNNVLTLKIKVVTWTNIIATFETPANEEFIEALLPAISAVPNYDAINSFINEAEEHEAFVDEDSDVKLELFKQFLHSPMKGYREKDFVSSKGEEYICITFSISYDRSIKFCLKKTDEVMTLWNEAIKPGARVVA